MGSPDHSSRRVTSLRGQLLIGLALLLFVAVMAVVAVLLLWLPQGWSPLAVAAGVLVLTAAEVGILVLFGDYLLRELLLEPLNRMVHDAERIARGDHRHRLDPRGPDELRRFADSLNVMAERLIDHKELLAENVESLERVNRALTEARDDLVRAEKLASVGRLAAGLAHEIGNPLNAILGYTDLAQRRNQGGEWVQGIEQEARRIDRIVEGLLDFARPKSGPPTEVELNEVVRETVDLLEVQGRLRGIAVSLELEEALPPVAVNPSQLQQILVNLLLNACDAIEDADGDGHVWIATGCSPYELPEGTRFRPRREEDPEEVDYSHLRRFRQPAAEYREPSFEPDEEVVTMEVHDDGAGIEAEPIQRVFDPFYTTKDPGRGTGLGLAVSARLAEGMGGGLRAARHEEAPGSVFTLLLPRADSDASAPHRSEDGEKSTGRTETSEEAT